MKRLKFLLAIVTVSVLPLQAQTEGEIPKTVEYGYISPRGINNWFVSVGGGTQLYLGNENPGGFSLGNFGIAGDFSFGKWVFPSMAFRAQLSGGLAHGIKSTLPQFHIASARVDLLWNVLDMGQNYRASRIFKLIPYIGAGAVSTIFASEILYSPSVTGGLLFNFRVSEYFSINADIRTSFFDGRMDRVRGLPLVEMMNFATLGGQFEINPKRFERRSEVTSAHRYEIDNLKRSIAALSKDKESAEKDIKDLNSRYYAMMKQNDSLKNIPKDTVEKVVEKVVEKKANVSSSSSSELAIFFANASAQITDKDMINLRYLAKAIRGSKGVSYTVTSYSDNRTGTASANKRLAEQRANAVINYLVSCGVERGRLKLEYNQFNDVPFNQPHLNRVVIIRTAE